MGKLFTGVKNAESLEIIMYARTVGLRGHEVIWMGKVFMKLRVMPNDISVDLESLKEKVKEVKPEEVEITDFGIQPIAFGIKALIVVAVMPDKEGIGDELIQKIESLEGVESVEIEVQELV